VAARALRLWPAAGPARAAVRRAPDMILLIALESFR
jgi:hypothetical protein